MKKEIILTLLLAFSISIFAEVWTYDYQHCNVFLSKISYTPLDDEGDFTEDRTSVIMTDEENSILYFQGVRYEIVMEINDFVNKYNIAVSPISLRSSGLFTTSRTYLASNNSLNYVLVIHIYSNHFYGFHVDIAKYEKSDIYETYTYQDTNGNTISEKSPKYLLDCKSKCYRFYIE